MIANPQQTDTVQQFLAYEKCYKITAATRTAWPRTSHVVLGQVSATKNFWTGPNDSRLAEVTLAPGERTRKP